MSIRTWRGVRRAVAATACAVCAACASRGDTGGPRYRAGRITVHGVIAPAPVRGASLADESVAVYMTIDDDSSVGDTLDRVTTPAAAMAMIHGESRHGGMDEMTPVAVLGVPAHGRVRLVPGVMHVMLQGLARPLAAGDTIALTLHFRGAGSLAVRAPVVSYADLEPALDTTR